MRGWALKIDGEPELRRDRGRAREHRPEALLDVDGLLAVKREEQVPARLDAKLVERARGRDPILVAVEHLLDRVAGDEDRGAGWKPSRRRLARLRSVYGRRTSLE